MAKKGTPPTTPSKKAPTTPVSKCKTCQRGCKNLLMVVQGCGRYLPK